MLLPTIHLMPPSPSYPSPSPIHSRPQRSPRPSPSPAMSSSPPPHANDRAEEEEGAARSGGNSGKAFSYGEAEYWDARYVEEGGAPYDWYQRYAALRPFVRRFAPPASRLLMIGCGSALMSEDMVNDDYVEIMNIDISSVVIEMMRKKYFNVPQLQCIFNCFSFPFFGKCIYCLLISFLLADMQMDVRVMGIFSDESFDCAIDKGTLDSLMCGVDAPLSAAQMVLEVDRLLKPGGVFMLITYGDPSVRVPHLNRPGCNWKIALYILPRPGFKGKARRPILDPVLLTESGRLPDGFVPEDPDSHYIYVCKKVQGLTGTSSPTTNHVERQDAE